MTVCKAGRMQDSQMRREQSQDSSDNGVCMTATVPVAPNSAVRSVVTKRGSFAARRQQLLPRVAAVPSLHCTLDIFAEKACWAMLESETRLRKHGSRHHSVHKKSHSVQYTLGQHSVLDSAFADCY